MNHCVRVPWEPLEAIIRGNLPLHVTGCPCFDGRRRVRGLCITSREIAEAAGIDVRSVYRYRKTGVPVHLAVRLPPRLDLTAEDVWPDLGEGIDISWDWMDFANCKGEDINLFFPERFDREAIAAAKALCSECTVVAECQTYAMANGEKDGIWGGKSTRTLRRERAESRRAYEAKVSLPESAA